MDLESGTRALGPKNQRSVSCPEGVNDRYLLQPPQELGTQKDAQATPPRRKGDGVEEEENAHTSRCDRAGKELTAPQLLQNPAWERGEIGN